MTWTLFFIKPGSGDGQIEIRLFRGHTREVTPVPIPNTEVKLSRADGTAWVTVWESRSSRDLLIRVAAVQVATLFYCQAPRADKVVGAFCCLHLNIVKEELDMTLIVSYSLVHINILL